jgi:hypothetical protein
VLHASTHRPHCPPGPAACCGLACLSRVGHIVVHGLVVNVLISTSPALHARAHHGAPALFPSGEPRRAHRDSRRRHLYDHDGATHTPNDGAIQTRTIISV